MNAKSSLRVEPRSTDVLLGRGNGASKWKGNINFRQVVCQYRDEYRNAVRYEKGLVAEKVFDHILTLTPPGRFLEMMDDDKFYPVIRERAIEKICQALREKISQSLHHCLSKSTKYNKGRYKPKHTIAIAPAPFPSMTAGFTSLDKSQPRRTEVVQPSEPLPKTFACSIRPNVITPDHTLTASDTREKSSRRPLLRTGIPRSTVEPHSTVLPIETDAMDRNVACAVAFGTKAKAAKNGMPYSSNSCRNHMNTSFAGPKLFPVEDLVHTTIRYPESSRGTNSIGISPAIDSFVSDVTYDVTPFQEQQQLQQQQGYARPVSFSAYNNSYVSSANQGIRMDSDEIVGASLPREQQTVHQQQYQYPSQPACSSVDSRRQQQHHYAIDGLFDFQQSFDIHLDGISQQCVADIEHDAQYSKSSIEILDEAFELIRNATEMTPMQTPAFQSTDCTGLWSTFDPVSSLLSNNTTLQ